MNYHVYTDESGSSNYDDLKQPVFGLTAVIIEEKQIARFEIATNNLLQAHGLPIHTEIHCNPCIMGEREFSIFNKTESYNFLKSFMTLGIEHIHAIQNSASLKSFVKMEVRQGLNSRGLDQYTSQVVWNVILIDRYFEHILDSEYKYFFDNNVQFAKPIKEILNALSNHDNFGLSLRRLRGNPTEIDSKNSRLIQFADVAGYYFNRNHQIETPNFRKSSSFQTALEKHEEKILEMYNLMLPKVLDWIKNGLLVKIDFKAIRDFRMPQN